MKIQEKIHWTPVFTIRKFADRQAYEKGAPFDISVFQGNSLLNEGIAAMWDLIMGEAATAFGNAASYIGVGDSTTAAAATQTGLQAVTNKAYAGMESGYPSRSGQTVTWRAVFGTDAGNFSWQEFTVVNSNSDDGVNLNRAVSNQGTKVAGQIWTIDVEITLS